MLAHDCLFCKCYSLRFAIVVAHVRGMRPAPTSKNHTCSEMLRKNSNTNTINQFLNYVLLHYF